MVPDADADELTQDVFVRVWQKLEGFRGEAAFGTWLYRLAVNLMLEARGQKARARTRFADQEALPELPARRVTRDERAARWSSMTGRTATRRRVIPPRPPTAPPGSGG